MQYALIINEHPEEMAKREGRDAPAYWAAWAAFSKAVAEAGVMRGGAGLQPPHSATTVTLSEGGHQVQDGPFSDSKEQLGGFFLIEAESLDEALTWASRLPSPEGKIEVRPCLPPQSSDE
ncbi:MAG: YciI family protein [Planctomycetota bacterium]